jgi:hypothetical protein
MTKMQVSEGVALASICYHSTCLDIPAYASSDFYRFPLFLIVLHGFSLFVLIFSVFIDFHDFLLIFMIRHDFHEFQLIIMDDH